MILPFEEDRSPTHGPWVEKQTRSSITLPDEIASFWAYIKLTPAEHKARTLLVARVQNLVRELWDGAHAVAFGYIADLA